MGGSSIFKSEGAFFLMTSRSKSVAWYDFNLQAQTTREHLSGDSAVPRDSGAAERVAVSHRETPRQL